MKGPIQYIKEAWVIYTKKENFIFFAKIMSVLAIISAILGYSVVYLKTQNNDLLLICAGLLIAIFGVWLNSTQYVVVLNQNLNPKDVFKLGFKKMWRFFLISIVLGFIILAGIILLIIPAFIFGIWYSFSLFLVMDKDLKIKEALTQSKLMVKNKFWQVLGINLVFGLFGFAVGFVVGLIPYVGSVIVTFLAPLFILPSYLLYRDLSAGLQEPRTV